MVEAGIVRWSLRRGRRSGKAAPLALAIAGLCGLALAATRHGPPRLIYNASASAPIGYYWVGPAAPLRRGELVLVRPPPQVRAFAAERGYLPPSVLLVKRIAALGGDQVCSDGAQLAINGRSVVHLLPADWLGRALPRRTGCRRLRPDQMLLLMTDVAASFDSRYFGPVPVADVMGRLVRVRR